MTIETAKKELSLHCCKVKSEGRNNYTLIFEYPEDISFYNKTVKNWAKDELIEYAEKCKKNRLDNENRFIEINKK